MGYLNTIRIVIGRFKEYEPTISNLALSNIEKHYLTSHGILWQDFDRKPTKECGQKARKVKQKGGDTARQRHECDFCGKIFNQKSDKASHLLTHYYHE